MSIYSSNYRDRLDISYILYHTQKPLVNTKISKYVQCDSNEQHPNYKWIITTAKWYEEWVEELFEETDGCFNS